jgi:hypothetical protein
LAGLDHPDFALKTMGGPKSENFARRGLRKRCRPADVAVREPYGQGASLYFLHTILPEKPAAGSKSFRHSLRIRY